MNVFSRIKNQFPHLGLEPAFSFARHTSIGTGGSALVAAYPTCAEEGAALLTYLKQEKIPYYPLGAGANVLPPDGSFEGVILRFSRVKSLYADKTTVYAGAGVTGGALLKFAHNKSLGGIEWLTGIPTTVGGGVCMNAGVQEGHFGSVVKKVLAIEGGKPFILSQEDCRFGVKNSVFMNGIVIFGAYFTLRNTSKEEIERKRCYFMGKRAHLPKGKSMGCTFLNFNGESAGAIIERCGCKGLCVGGAHVSNEHANFIINNGGTSSDVSSLIALVKRRVYEREGILLHEEIRRILPLNPT